MTVGNDGVLGVANLSVPDATQHRVVGQQVGVGGRIGGVVQAHHFDTRVGTAAQPAAHEVAPDAAETINGNTKCHSNSG